MKKLLTVLVILVALYLGLCAVMPSEFNVSRSTEIEAPVPVVYNQVAVLKNWENWSPWAEMDSTMVTTYIGAESGVGQKSAWTSENSGEGKMEFLAMEDNKSISTSLDFGDQGTAKGTWTFNETPNGTKVTWQVIGDMGFFARPMGMLMDNLLGSQFEQGLGNLKEVAESMPAEPAYKVGMKVLPRMSYLSATDSCEVEMIGAKLAELYGEIMGAMGGSEVEMAGMPFAIYHSFDYETTTIEAGIPVSGETSGSENVSFNTMEPCKAAFTTHIGGYDTSPAHEAIDAYMKENNLVATASPIEFYVNDPEEVGMDNAETVVAYPISAAK